MKNNKKILCCKIILLMICVSQFISPVYADINKESAINISFENIEDIIEAHNIDLKVAHNTLKQSRENYDDICDDIDNLEKSQKENKDKISNLANAKNTMEDQNELAEMEETLKALKLLDTDISDKIDEMEDERDKLKYSIKIQKDKYNILTKDLLFKAQNQYVQCLILNNKEVYLKNKISYEKNMADIYKYKLQSGFISQKDFDEYSIDNTGINNELEKVINDKNLAFKNLKNILGISQNESINISADISVDLDNINKINLSEDTEEMLENSLNIHIKKIELDCTEDLNEDDDYEIDNSELLLEQEKKNAVISFQTQYNLVMESYNSIKNSTDALAINEKSIKAMKDVSVHGFDAKNKIDKTQLDLDEQNNNLNAEINMLYANYSKYIQMKSGY